MKLETEDIKQLIEIAAALQPVADQVADVVISYGPALRKVVDEVLDYTVARQARSVALYHELGFAWADALTLVLDEKFAIQRLSERIGRGK